MAAQREQPQPDILHPSLFEFLRRFFHALAIGAHRVLPSGHKEHRQILFHAAQIFGLLHIAYPLQQLPQQAAAGRKAAAGVGNIGIYYIFVPGEPVIFRPGVLYMGVVAAEHQVLEPGAGILLPYPAAHRLTHPDRRRKQGPGLPAGAADDGSGDPGVRVFGQDGSRHKGAHRVAEENIGHIRVFLPGLPQQIHAVLHGGEPAPMEIPLDPFLSHRLAVAHMVLGHHQEAQAVQIPRKIIVTLDELGDAVDDLHHGSDFPRRSPAAAVEPAHSHRGDSKFLPDP